MKDDISSNVTCIGVTGYLYSGQVHKGMLGFLEQGKMIQLNLQAKSMEPISEKRLKQLGSLKDSVLQRAGSWISGKHAGTFKNIYLILIFKGI